jgi:hypothetical protein
VGCERKAVNEDILSIRNKFSGNNESERKKNITASENMANDGKESESTKKASSARKSN